MAKSPSKSPNEWSPSPCLPSSTGATCSTPSASSRGRWTSAPAKTRSTVRVFLPTADTCARSTCALIIIGCSPPLSRLTRFSPRVENFDRSFLLWLAGDDPLHCWKTVPPARPHLHFDAPCLVLPTSTDISTSPSVGCGRDQVIWPLRLGPSPHFPVLIVVA